jgi:WD40 repeat protein
MGVPLTSWQKLAVFTTSALIGISFTTAQSAQESKPLQILSGHTDKVSAIAFGTSKTLISGSRDSTLKVWDLDTKKLLRTLSAKSAGITSIAVSGDRQIVVSGDIDKSVKVWNLKTGKLQSTINEHSQPVESVAISSDGKLVATISQLKFGIFRVLISKATYKTPSLLPSTIETKTFSN